MLYIALVSITLQLQSATRSLDKQYQSAPCACLQPSLHGLLQIMMLFAMYLLPSIESLTNISFRKAHSGVVDQFGCMHECVQVCCVAAENMRREGFELSVSPPVVVYR